MHANYYSISHTHSAYSSHAFGVIDLDAMLFSVYPMCSHNNNAYSSHAIDVIDFYAMLISVYRVCMVRFSCFI